eukprot:377956-Amphidinium_carterae.1
MSYKRTDDPHEFSSSWTGFTYIKQESQGEIPIVPGGDAFAMVDSGASHMILPLKSLQSEDMEKANKINVKLAVGNRTAYTFRDEVFAEGRVQHLMPLCRVSEKLELSLVLSDGVGQLRCTDDDGKSTSHLLTFTRFQGMQWVSKEQLECLRQALWTVQLGTVTCYNTSFWKDVALNGFSKYLTGIEDYESHSARSVRFVHDMDPIGATSESDGEVLEPPTPHSIIDGLGWKKAEPEDSEEDAVDPEVWFSTFFGRAQVDFVCKIEPMLLEEHVPAGQRWDNVKSVLLGAYTRQGCGVSKHTQPKEKLPPHLHALAQTVLCQDSCMTKDARFPF